MNIDLEKFEVSFDNEDLEKLCIQSWEYPPEALAAIAALKVRLEKIFCSGVPFQVFEEETGRCYDALMQVQKEIGTPDFPETQVNLDTFSIKMFSNGVKSLGDYLLEDVGMSYMKDSINAGCQDILDSSADTSFGSVVVKVNPKTLDCNYSTNINFDERDKKILDGATYAALDIGKDKVIEVRGEEVGAFVGEMDTTKSASMPSPI